MRVKGQLLPVSSFFLGENGPPPPAAALMVNTCLEEVTIFQWQQFRIISNRKKSLENSSDPTPSLYLIPLPFSLFYHRVFFFSNRTIFCFVFLETEHHFQCNFMSFNPIPHSTVMWQLLSFGHKDLVSMCLSWHRSHSNKYTIYHLYSKVHAII